MVYRFLLFVVVLYPTIHVGAQSPKTELYDLVRKFMYDSTGYENVGIWGVGQPGKYPVKWKADRVEMSDDTSINFFRMGTASVQVNGRSLSAQAKPALWNIMLKGARSGYSFFTITSPPLASLPLKSPLDSLFGKRPFKARLLKSCDQKPRSAYHYYEVKMPRKDNVYLRVEWTSGDSGTSLRIDGFDTWSQYAARLVCPD